MLIDINMPGFGESITEGTVIAWLKQAGDHVALNEPLLEITTDKITADVPAPAAGILAKIVVGEGETVRVGTVIGQILTSSVPTGAGPSEQHHRPSAPIIADPSTQQTVSNAAPDQNSPPISPVVATLVAEHHLNLSQITGTGIGGRVSKQDVLRFLARQSLHPPMPPTPQPSSDQEIVPLSSMRRAIAEHMTRSVRDIPQVTTIFEVDFGRVVSHYTQHKPSFAQQGIRLTYTCYVIHAVVQALRAIPILNGRYTSEGLILNRHIHIGIAVALTEGLVVPILRDADQQNLRGIARSLAELSERARSNHLAPSETQDGTFTISNYGVGGSIIGTPIINQQQAGILGIGAIVKRPVVIEQHGIEAIAIRPISYLALTFDHRVCDGADADRFLGEVKRTLEAEQHH